MHAGGNGSDGGHDIGTELVADNARSGLAIAVISEPQRRLGDAESEGEHREAGDRAREQHPPPRFLRDRIEGEGGEVSAGVPACPENRQRSQNPAAHVPRQELDQHRLVHGVVGSQHESDRHAKREELTPRLNHELQQ